MSDLPRLAELIRARNTVEGNIANLIGNAVNLNTVSEYIAAAIFGITLIPAKREFSGIFSAQPLRGKTVDVQWYPRREGALAVHTDPAPDYYLILAGPKQETGAARPPVNPWLISSVHLFAGQELLSYLYERGVQIGSRTSVINQLWENAEIFPNQHNHKLLLSDEQRSLLSFFQ